MTVFSTAQAREYRDAPMFDEQAEIEMRVHAVESEIDELAAAANTAKLPYVEQNYMDLARAHNRLGLLLSAIRPAAEAAE